MKRYLQQETLYPPLVTRRPSRNLEYVIIIPAMREEFVLLQLRRLQRCQLPPGDGEVILLLNEPRDADPVTKAVNQRIYLQMLDWVKQKVNPRLRFYVHWLDDLPETYSGPGLARKIGMDEACYRLEKARNRSGWIFVLDADIRVENTMLVEIYKKAKSQPRSILIPRIPLQLRGLDQSETFYQAAARLELLNWYQNFGKKRNLLPSGALWIPKNIYLKLKGLRSFNDSTWKNFLNRALEMDVVVKELEGDWGQRLPRGEGRCKDGLGVKLVDFLKGNDPLISSNYSQNPLSVEEAIMELLKIQEYPDLPTSLDPVKLMLFCRNLNVKRLRGKTF